MYELETIRDTLNDLFQTEIQSPTRRREVAEKRFIYVKIAKEDTYYTYKAIGNVINRDHSTVIHAFNKFEILNEVDEKFKADYIKATQHPAILKIKENNYNKICKERIKYHRNQMKYHKDKIRILTTMLIT